MGIIKQCMGILIVHNIRIFQYILHCILQGPFVCEVYRPMWSVEVWRICWILTLYKIIYIMFWNMSLVLEYNPDRGEGLSYVSQREAFNYSTTFFYCLGKLPSAEKCLPTCDKRYQCLLGVSYIFQFNASIIYLTGDNNIISYTEGDSTTRYQSLPKDVSIL